MFFNEIYREKVLLLTKTYHSATAKKQKLSLV